MLVRWFSCLRCNYILSMKVNIMLKREYTSRLWWSLYNRWGIYLTNVILEWWYLLEWLNDYSSINDIQYHLTETLVSEWYAIIYSKNQWIVLCTSFTWIVYFVGTICHVCWYTTRRCTMTSTLDLLQKAVINYVDISKYDGIF